MLVLVLACGGAPAKVTITTPQEYENVVVQVIEDVIEIFNSAGINCQMLTSDLKSLRTSPKVTAAREWKASHPEAMETTNAKVQERRPEIEKAAAPGIRQCGVRLESVMATLSED
jgi:hypothetical protein